MKRIRNHTKYLRNQRRAAKRGTYTRSRETRGTFGLYRAPEFSHGYSKTKKIVAPEFFSLTQNPDEVITFFTRIDVAGRTQDAIFIDLENVRIMTLDAVLLLVSKIKHHRSRCKAVGGNQPKDTVARALLAQSGFYDFVTNKPSDYHQNQNHGFLKKHEGKRVRHDVCAELIHFATKRVYGVVQKQGGLYRTLIELMANTRDHAKAGNSNSEAWWVSVYVDNTAHVAHFAFLDSGVGIFKSVKMQNFLRQLGQLLELTSRKNLLLDILDGQLGSRTGLPYRGKGLPAINRVHSSKQIRNLKIVTNDTSLDVTTRTGKRLLHGFRGTCLTWEVHRA